MTNREMGLSTAVAFLLLLCGVLLASALNPHPGADKCHANDTGPRTCVTSTGYVYEEGSTWGTP
jgi:hypothetical protein